MKKCEEHHGEIQYDERIYLECPLCKVELKKYDELAGDNSELVEDNEKMSIQIDDLKTAMEDAINKLEEFV